MLQEARDPLKQFMRDAACPQFVQFEVMVNNIQTVGDAHEARMNRWAFAY